MKTVKVRIHGTINDLIELTLADAGLPEDATDDEILAAALDDWRFVEFEDLTGEME